MRIALDLTSGIGDPTGIGTYTRELARALLRRPGGHELRIAVHAFRHPGWHRKVRRILAGCGPYTVAVNRMIPHGLLLETERRLGLPPLEALFGRCDVFHGTNFLAPPSLRARTVITIHDLAFLRFAEELPVPHRYHRWIGGAIARAARIVAVSEATRRDVAALFPAAAEKVRVVPEAPSTESATAPEAEMDAFRRAHGIPERYFLFVGTLEPRKNLAMLLRAWRAAARAPELPGLVLAGRAGWDCAGVVAASRGPSAAPAPIWTGFVSASIRQALYREATAVVYPSLYEGFGLPVLEAMAAGAPVLASSAGGIPGTARDAAWLLAPGDEAGWRDAMIRIADDAELRAELARRGRARAAEFSWERTAAETLAVYEEAASTAR